MQNLKKLAILSFFAALGFNASAQDKSADGHQITIVVPEVALLDIETAERKDFAATFPTTLEAGEKIAAAEKNSSLWLNYSSILYKTESRHIDVRASALIPGVDITVEAGESTSGSGTLGKPTGSVILTEKDQPIITSIGSAYTNSGAKNGHQLTYSFSTPDENYAKLRAGKTAVTLTYTLADN